MLNKCLFSEIILQQNLKILVVNLGQKIGISGQQ